MQGEGTGRCPGNLRVTRVTGPRSRPRGLGLAASQERPGPGGKLGEAPWAQPWGGALPRALCGSDWVGRVTLRPLSEQHRSHPGW